MTVTLASMSRLIEMLSERDQPETTPENLRDHLVTATSLINSFMGVSPEGGSTVVRFPTYRRRRPTVGIALPFSDREPLPTFDLPVAGPLTGLQVRYRGGEDVLDYGDPLFNWDTIIPMREREDYLHDPETGRLTFLNHFDRDLPDGVEVRYGHGSTSLPDVAVGDTLRTLIAQVAVSTDTPAPSLPRAFAGVPHKKAADSVALTGAPVIELAFPQPLSHLRLFAPRDVPFAAGGVAVFGRVNDAQPAVTLLGSDATPKIADVYEMRATYAENVRQLRLSIIGLQGTAYLSRISLGFYHPTWRHFDGVVPEVVSQACALLAKTLRGRSANDGVGKVSDRSNRSYSGTGSMPQEIRDMLQPLSRTRSGVMMI